MASNFKEKLKKKFKGISGKRLRRGIIAVVLSLVVVFVALFSLNFTEIMLKAELSKGFYESPYIVRPLEDITINGVSVEEYFISFSDDGEEDVYSLAVDTLVDEINKACGKKPEISEKETENVFIIEKTLYDTDTFTLRAEKGKVYIKGSATAGISRGIAAFADEVLMKSEGVFHIKDGYEFTKEFSDYISYEDFGAKGDGKKDDLDAIVKAHEYANEKGLPVFAKEGATYYIGGADKTAVVMTDTDWSTARFIIDDTKVESRSAWVFDVAPSQAEINITELFTSLDMDATNIGATLEARSLVVITDSNEKKYIRKGANENSGSSQADVIIVDEEGNISEETPLIWDFENVTDAVAYPIDEKGISLKGGIFTTLANNEPSEYNYYARGILVRRSNTVVDGIYHDIENEGDTGAPYSAFISISRCADVTVKNSTFTGHKKYYTIGSGGSSVPMGTYDLNASTAVNTRFINCNQTNDITDIDYWGIAGSNYCKNLIYDGCALSRYDAHQGVLNATIKNSVIGHHGIKLIGSGTALIENTTVLSESFIELRPDYGSSWRGDLIIRNCKYYPKGFSNCVIKAENSEDHNFGYTCYMPQNIEIDGFEVHKIGTCYLFNNINPDHKSESYKGEYPVVPPEKITVKNYKGHIFGSLKVSKNDAIFNIEIS